MVEPRQTCHQGKGAVVVSGIMFSGSHLYNPGASPIWLLRSFLQGAVLACAVYRTQSLWWSVGYHTGWNWISAPLFGAAGSGYLDEGHVFDFMPHGSSLITGGSGGKLAGLRRGLNGARPTHDRNTAALWAKGGLSLSIGYSREVAQCGVSPVRAGPVPARSGR